MVDAGGFARREGYRTQFLPVTPQDRPLVLQLGGSNINDLAVSASLGAVHCDAVELNVGCPQRCARKGGYGSFCEPPCQKSSSPCFSVMQKRDGANDAQSSPNHPWPRASPMPEFHYFIPDQVHTA